MKQENLAILGSTGSIGTQTLDLVRANPKKFHLFGLTAHSNWSLLAQQINEFRPDYAIITEGQFYPFLKEALSHNDTKLLAGYNEIANLVGHEKVTIVLNSLVGFAGFYPTFIALRNNKRVALANKESLVVAGKIIKDVLKGREHLLLPVDSEHSAIFQCLTGENNRNVEKLIITASGGPFRTWNYEHMKDITVEQALNHPNWDMGAKITIDSATMMNKGLEIIEAYWLFDLPLEKIEAVIHPQSIIHSMVTFQDGSTKAQMGLPDMKVPILYALSYPDRLPAGSPRIDWTKMVNLTFEPVDHKRFPCLSLAREALEQGGCATAVLNASNEVAVNRFLNKEISYIQIPSIVEKSLEKLANGQTVTVDSLFEIDKETREIAASIS